VDVERTRTRKTRFICTQRCVKKSSATRRYKDSPAENDSVQIVVVWMQLIVVKITRLGFRSWTICHVCVLEHCCTQLRNSELQQTITQSHVTRSQGDDSSKFRVGRGWEGGVYKQLIFARLVFSLQFSPSVCLLLAFSRNKMCVI
jgi:hypothetical protein